MVREGFTDTEIESIRDEIHQYTIDIGKVLKGLYAKFGIEVNDANIEFVVSHTVVVHTMVNSLIALVEKLGSVKKKKELTEFGSQIDITEILKTFIKSEYDSEPKN